jgi:uncharacterized membrane protein YphA (DoxX/SURF4 family)
MKTKFSAIVISLFFIALFLYSGTWKIMNHQLFGEELSVSPIPAALSTWMVWIIPLVEILITILLLRPAWRLKGLYASLILMVFFTIYILIPDPSNSPFCGCGGFIEELSLKQHLIFNTACIILSLFAIMELSIDQRTRWLQSLSVVAIVLMFSVIGLVITLSMRVPSNERTGLEGKPIPSVNLLLGDSITILNTKDISAGKPIIIIELSPYCPHCKAEITDILHHIDYFKDAKIYLITAFSYKDLTALSNNFQLEKYANIQTGIDSGGAFMSYYKASVVPYTAIYDNQKKLVRAMSGRADINSLIRFASN